MVTMLFVPLAALAGISWWLLSRDAIKARDVIVAVVLVTWIAAVGVKVYKDRIPSEAQDSAGVASSFRVPDWATVGAESTATEPAATATSGGMTAAPVEQLIAGLEERLASEPNDVKGWVLLAQSYAFVGDTASTERALERAVALGADEQALRARVQAARREPEAHSWIERTVGG